MKLKHSHLTRRAFALLIALAVALACVPAVGSKSMAASTKTVFFTVSKPSKTGIVKVKSNGKLNTNQYGYANLYVETDGSLTLERSLYSSSVNISVDMKKYPVGYHGIYVSFYEKSTGYTVTSSGQTVYDIKEYVPTKIYGKPANGLTRYEVYAKKFFFTAGDYYSHDYDCDQYLEYKRAKAKKWKSFGRMSSAGTTYQKKGLKPGKKYKTRVYYGKKFTYKGKDYFWKGKMSTVRTIKTGAAKTPVKSFKVQAYNVRRHAIRHYGYYTGVYLYTEYYYTYNLRAVVTMKRKPKAKGVNICGKWVRGNRKRYTKNLGSFTSSSKPQGKSVKVSIYSYQSRKYGGYSPLYKKTRKIR